MIPLGGSAHDESHVLILVSLIKTLFGRVFADEAK